MFSLNRQLTNIEQIRNQVQQKLNGLLRPLNELPDSAYVAGSRTVWSALIRLCLSTFFKTRILSWTMVGHAFNPSAQEAEAGRYDFLVNLVYIVSSRTSRAT